MPAILLFMTGGRPWATRTSKIFRAGRMLELAALLLLAGRCAPTVAPETLLSLVYVESRFDPLAIGVNTGARPARRPIDVRDAARTAKHLISAGGSVDLGLGQINSRNLGWLGLSVNDAFEPCANLDATARLLQHNFGVVAVTEPNPQRALRTALSLYNTGDRRRGFLNGYVARVEASARHITPAIDGLVRREAPPRERPTSAAAPPADTFDHNALRRPPASALVFSEAAPARFEGQSLHGETR